MDTSIFEQITSALTVKSLCSPLGPDVPAEYTFADLEILVAETGVDPFSTVSRVVAYDGSVPGIIWFEDYLVEREEPPVEEVMQRLQPNEMLSSDTVIRVLTGPFSTNFGRSAACFAISATDMAIGAPVPPAGMSPR